MSDPKTVPVVVALELSADGRKVLLTWNRNWGGFTFPMTKPKADPPAEGVEAAAVRAAAEVVRRPVRVAEKTTGGTRGLLRSARDAAIKNYVYTVVPLEVHPDFAGFSGEGFWAEPDDLDGEYAPLTATVAPLLAQLREWGWV